MKIAFMDSLQQCTVCPTFALQQTPSPTSSSPELDLLPLDARMFDAKEANAEGLPSVKI